MKRVEKSLHRDSPIGEPNVRTIPHLLKNIVIL